MDKGNMFTMSVAIFYSTSAFYHTNLTYDYVSSNNFMTLHM